MNALANINGKHFGFDCLSSQIIEQICHGEMQSIFCLFCIVVELVREAWKLLSHPIISLDRFFDARNNYLANKINVNKLSFITASRAVRPQLVSLIAKIRQEEKTFLTDWIKITKRILLKAASKKI